MKIDKVYEILYVLFYFILFYVVSAVQAIQQYFAAFMSKAVASENAMDAHST